MRAILVLFIIVSTSFTQTIHAQGQSEITLKGRVGIAKKMCVGAELTLCQLSAASDNCNEVSKLTTTKNGQFELKLNRDSAYRIKVKAAGYTDRLIEFNTTLPKESVDPAKLTFEVEIDLTNYPEATETVTVASIYFDAAKGNFNYRIPQK